MAWYIDFRFQFFFWASQVPWIFAFVVGPLGTPLGFLFFWVVAWLLIMIASIYPPPPPSPSPPPPLPPHLIVPFASLKGLGKRYKKSWGEGGRGGGGGGVFVLGHRMLASSDVVLVFVVLVVDDNGCCILDVCVPLHSILILWWWTLCHPPCVLHLPCGQ